MDPLLDLHDAYVTAVRRLQTEPEAECVIVDAAASDAMVGTVVLVRGPAAEEVSAAIRAIMDRWEQPTQPFFPREQENT